MFRRQITNRLKIGRYLGIDLYIHWTFWFLMFGVGLSALFSAGWQTAEGWWAAGASMLQISVLFLCVTLHEYGHALMARRFKVRTVDITLLPIGGLARLERMPRKPIEEFLVAVAGPAVNVVIAGFTAIGLYFLFQSADVASYEEAIVMLGEHFLGWLFVINVALVIFNMVPAFPMDGGRVLRSILASFMDYGTATFVASRIGFVIALLMAAAGFYLPQVTMVLVAGFIAYAGWMEARQVALTEALRGMRVEDYLEPVPYWVRPHASMDELAELFARIHDEAVPVCGVEGYLLGSVDRAVVTRAAEQEGWDKIASDLMDDGGPVLHANQTLEPQLSSLKVAPYAAIPVVNAQGQLIGVVKMAQILQRLFGRPSRTSSPTPAAPITGPPAQSPAPSGGTPLQDGYL